MTGTGRPPTYRRGMPVILRSRPSAFGPAAPGPVPTLPLVQATGSERAAVDLGEELRGLCAPLFHVAFVRHVNHLVETANVNLTALGYRGRRAFVTLAVLYARSKKAKS